MAGPTLVSGQSNSGSSATSGVTVTLGSAITAGHLLIAVATTDDGTQPGASEVSDASGSNTWTRLVVAAAGGSVDGASAVYACLNAAAGSYGISFNHSTNFVGLSVSEFNPNGQSGTDGTNSATGAGGTTANPGNITTTNANDSIFAGAVAATVSVTWAAGTGYTLLSSVNSNANTNVGAQYQAFSTTVSGQSTAFGVAPGGKWSAAAAAVKAVSGSTIVDEDEGVQYYPSTWGFAL